MCSSPTPSLDHEQADGSGYSLRYGAYRSPMMPTDAYWAARARPACSLMEPGNLPRTESAPAQSCRGALEGRGPSTSRKAGTANEITAAVRVLSNHSRGPAPRAPRLVRWSLRMSGRRRWNCGGIRASAADSRPPHRVEARQQDRIVAEPAANHVRRVDKQSTSIVMDVDRSPTAGSTNEPAVYLANRIKGQVGVGPVLEVGTVDPRTVTASSAFNGNVAKQTRHCASYPAPRTQRPGRNRVNRNPG